MSLQKQIMEEMKAAMKSKDTIALQALRAVKSAFLLAKSEAGAGGDLTEDQEMKIIQKQVKHFALIIHKVQVFSQLRAVPRMKYGV